MSLPDIDSLFSTIDSIGKDLEAEKAQRSKKGGGGGKLEFKNLEMTFLGAPKGSYEMRVIIDGNGKFSEEISLHTIQIGKEKKITITCTGENCEVCKRQKKLDEMKNKAAWKFRPYKLHKILVKIGDVPSAKGLNPGQVYVAYVDDKYFKPLIDTINNSKKYYKDDIAKMLTPTEKSGGFLVNASTTGKTSTYNFNFIPQMVIDAINIKEIFGYDKYKIENFGYFRNGHVNEEKLKKAISGLDSLILATAGKKVSTTSADPEPESHGEDESNQNAETTDHPVDNNPPFEPDNKVEKIVAESVDAPTAPVVATIDPAKLVRNSKALSDADGKPQCMSYFDPNDSECSASCQHKRDCLLATMEAGRV